MTDISGFGLRVVLRASNTFPAGITITQFADDADPLDNPVAAVAEAALGLNGDLVSWGSAQPQTLVLNVLPRMEDDRNLEILARANITSKGARPARDVITATVIYPDSRVVTLSQGVILSATLAPGVASAGRIKTRPYTFAFETSTSN